MRKLAFAAALLPLAVLPAHAQDPLVGNERPEATLVISAKAINAGVGYTWGNGLLYYHGHEHHFTVKGINVAAVGFARITGHGRVYHLHNLQDFSGTYGALTGQATLVNGIGGQFLHNASGVMIRVDQVTKGVNLAGSADGIQLTLTD
jgi:hypothetical protein